MRRYNLNVLKTAIPALLIIFSLACGDTLITTFRVAVASSRPFVQSLVQSGVINQGKADAVIGDINNGIDAASRGEQCLKATTGTGNEAKVAKAKCYFALAQDLRQILARHNIGGNPKLDQIAGIVEGAIAAFEEFFRSTTSPSISAAQGSKQEDPEKVLETKMKALNAQMKAVTSQ